MRLGDWEIALPSMAEGSRRYSQLEERAAEGRGEEAT
eukprot:gene11385-7654_t